MDWQQLAALAVVGVTAAVMAGVKIRRLRKGSPRTCSACRGCPALEFRAGNTYLESPPQRPEKSP